MAETVQVPVSLLRKMSRAATAFAEFEDELEDFPLSQNVELISRLREARAAPTAGHVRSPAELKQELRIPKRSAFPSGTCLPTSRACTSIAPATTASCFGWTANARY